LAWALVIAGCAVDPAGLPAPDGSVATSCSNDDECSDGVDCTDDLCGSDGICTFMEVDSRCAGGEVCIGGRGCQPESDCNADECEDALRVALTCQIGACQPDGTCLGESVCAAGESCCGDGTCMDCDDGNPCTADSCDASAGGCVHTPLDGTPCDDGDFCTGTEVCVAGTCESSGDPCVASTVCDVTRCVGCRNDGDCPGDIVPPYGSCEYSDTCDQSAVQRRTVTSFACVAEECVGTDTEETNDCSRNTNGTMCAPDEVTGYSACSGYDDTCDETGTQSRERTTYACAGGSCDSSTASESRSCSRDTDGTTCMPTVRPDWGPCGGFDDDCDEMGTQSRTITVYQCADSSCDGTDMNRMQDCTRETDGDTGCGTPPDDMVTTCVKTSSDPCNRDGERTRTTFGTMCTDGSCVNVPSTMTESCMVPSTDGDACGDVSGPCPGVCSGGSCDNNANNGDTCGGTGPCAGECDAGSCNMSANNGDSCDDGISCTGDGMCSDGTCEMGSEECSNSGGDCGTPGCTGGRRCDCLDGGGGSWACGCVD
jgi:hypothetical protein